MNIVEKKDVSLLKVEIETKISNLRKNFRKTELEHNREARAIEKLITKLGKLES